MSHQYRVRCGEFGGAGGASEGQYRKQKDQSGTALKTQVREGAGCHVAAEPRQVLTLPGHLFKKKSSPETANIPERWKRRCCLTTWGRATTRKQSSQLGQWQTTHVYLQGQGH